jgi:hypothetical protein
MQCLLTAALVFVCVLGGVLLGMYLRRILPADHLRAETKEVVGLGMGLVSALTALLLALVISSAKESFDFEGNQLRQAAVDVLLLDRTLADYGPETREIRDALRLGIERRLQLTWTGATGSKELQSAATDAGPYRLMARIRQLAPHTDLQRQLQSQALQQVTSILKSRWLMFEATTATVPALFLVIVVFWLTVIFASFGLYAPVNITAVVVLLVCALSVAGSVFLILELDTPFSGVMRVSDAPLRLALAQLGR